MSCPTCEQINCIGQQDTLLYSLEGDIYPFVLNCPPGYDCNEAGSFLMVCCGQLISVDFPIDATAETKELLIKSVVSQCSTRQAYCNEVPPGDPPGDPEEPPPPVQLYLNRTKYCSYLCADGSPFIFTVLAGTFAALSQADADSEAQNYACKMAKARRVCLTSNIPSETCANSAFSRTVTASGATVSSVGNLWQVVAGSLPTGLFLSGSGPIATISGTPTVGGTFTFSVQIITPVGDYQVKSFAICVVDIYPATPLTPGTVGTDYSETFTTDACASTPLSWQVESGTLPTGLTLDESTGVLSGTPTASGTYTFQILLQTAAT